MYADLWLFSAFDRNTHQFKSAFTTSYAMSLLHSVDLENLYRFSHKKFKNV